MTQAAEKTPWAYLTKVNTLVFTAIQISLGYWNFKKQLTLPKGAQLRS